MPNHHDEQSHHCAGRDLEGEIAAAVVNRKEIIPIGNRDVNIMLADIQSYAPGTWSAIEAGLF